jgi:hypothetical protein
MKKFNSVGNYINECIGYARNVTFIVENDMDRNHLSEDDLWSDLRPAVEIDGRVFEIACVQGKSGGYTKPENLNKGTLLGLNVAREIK